ncbi:MAG: hypothetical protein R3E01_22935 [Pirellulaceae bacterium]
MSELVSATEMAESKHEVVKLPRSLVAFVILQVVLGAVCLLAGTIRLFDIDRTLYFVIPLPLPPFTMGTLHLLLAFSIARQKTWSWIPNALVVSVPIIWLVIAKFCGGLLL